MGHETQGNGMISAQSAPDLVVVHAHATLAGELGHQRPVAALCAPGRWPRLGGQHRRELSDPLRRWSPGPKRALWGRRPRPDHAKTAVASRISHPRVSCSLSAIYHDLTALAVPAEVVARGRPPRAVTALPAADNAFPMTGDHAGSTDELSSNDTLATRLR
jgi:hypothetical protein